MANKKISALSAASALAGTEVTPVVQSGSTVKATIAQVATYVQAQRKVAVTTTDPTATSDTAAGYTEASTWVNTTSDQSFTCVDATNSNAVWLRNGTDNLSLFGDGQDGNLASGGGTTVLSRDTYYRNVTLTGSDRIRCNGWRLFISGTLDITGLTSGAIEARPASPNGGNASVASAGAAATGYAGTTTGSAATSAAGVAGGTGAGTVGTAATGAATNNGGNSGASGAGGKASAGATAGGGLRAANAATAVPFGKISDYLARFTTLINGGAAGGSGGGGAGDGANNGGGSGGGGCPGGVLQVHARRINRGASTVAGAFSVEGGNGGNGGGGAGGNAGGGGGGAGGGGGWLWLVYAELLGATATGCLSANGGTGGNGGNGAGTGEGGSGGQGGNGGRIQVWSIRAQTGTTTFTGTGTAGSGPTGTTGGTGGAGATNRVDL